MRMTDKDLARYANRYISSYIGKNIDDQEEKKFKLSYLDIRKIKKICLDNTLDLNEIKNFRFDKDQINEIRLGLKDRIDITKYLDPNIESMSMMQIRLGLEKDIDISSYIDSFNWIELSLIRLGLEDGLDVSKYADPGFNIDQMSMILDGLKAGIDISPYFTKE